PLPGGGLRAPAACRSPMRPSSPSQRTSGGPMGRSSRWFGILVLVLLTACASGGAGGQRIDRNLLTREQILETNRQNAYEVVENLRSNWLRTRGPTSLTQEDAVVQVYLDDNRLGGVETLRTINTTLIQYIRW